MTTTAVPARADHLTFKGNLNGTRHAWLRLTPAYSVGLVGELLDRHGQPDGPVLDPFCGTGTTALTCAERGISCDTTDLNPFLIWLARAKCASYDRPTLDRVRAAAATIAAAASHYSTDPEWLPDLHQIEKWWDPAVLRWLGQTMCAIRQHDREEESQAGDLLRLAFCRLLIETAHVSFGHQSMSFRRRSDDGSNLFQTSESGAYRFLTSKFITEVERLIVGAQISVQRTPRILLCDARKLTPTLAADAYALVITSPPYPNRMSYIRELRPYMYWLGFLKSGREAGELDWQAIGGTWGCATSNLTRWSPPDAPLPQPALLTPVVDEIEKRSSVLARYVTRYFSDMASHVSELHRVVRDRGEVHYIVGNSKFYDVLLPVEEIFAQLFESAGFERVEIRTLRKRSSKKELFEYDVVVRKKD